MCLSTEQAKGDGKAHTAQQTIPYVQMYPDGKITFEINYPLEST